MLKPDKETLDKCLTHWEFKSANVLIEALSPTSGVFSFGSRYSFRGQGSNAFKLIPSAWRLFNQNNHSLRPGVGPMPDLVKFEALILLEFATLANQNGLSTLAFAGDFESQFQLLRTYGGLNHSNTFIPEPWPDQSLLPLMALAQHYGVPTRLLDWTSNPYFAAYFAAEDYRLNKPDVGDAITIWAINDCATNVPQRVNEAMKTSSGSRFVRFYKPSYLGNDRIVTQQGHFSYSKANEASPNEGLEEYCFSGMLGNSSQAFDKITLPYSEVYALIRILRRQGVSAASLFPGYIGAARSTIVDNISVCSEVDYKSFHESFLVERKPDREQIQDLVNKGHLNYRESTKFTRF